MIALATTLNLYLYGRITGLSGIFNSIIKGDVKGGLYWKICFMVGLLTPPVLLGFTNGLSLQFGDTTIVLFDEPAYSIARLSVFGWVLGGFLVGWGTKMGNGCTSGHGVCGIPRLAPRSIVATCTFMSFGIAVATLKHYLGFLDSALEFSPTYTQSFYTTTKILLCIFNVAALFLITQAWKERL